MLINVLETNTGGSTPESKVRGLHLHGALTEAPILHFKYVPNISSTRLPCLSAHAGRY